jgi:hypothetical protein
MRVQKYHSFPLLQPFYSTFFCLFLNSLLAWGLEPDVFSGFERFVAKSAVLQRLFKIESVWIWGFPDCAGIRSLAKAQRDEPIII